MFQESGTITNQQRLLTSLHCSIRFYQKKNIFYGKNLLHLLFCGVNIT